MFKKINTPNNRNNRYINLNGNKCNDRNIKLKHDNSNLIMINFNINNITNNNINKNKINNYFINKFKSERTKKNLKKSDMNNCNCNYNNNKMKKFTNKSNIILNDISTNYINSLSRINSSYKLKIKNNTITAKNKSKSKSKSKNKNKEINYNKYCYNNSLIKKLTKANISQVRLLKNKNKTKNIDIDKYIHKTNSQIYSISLTNRDNNSKTKEKNNISINTISLLNDGKNKSKNNARKINILFNNNIKEIKYKIKNKSIKDLYSVQNLKLKNVISNTKNISTISNKNHNIDSKRNKKIKKNIPMGMGMGLGFGYNKFNYESILKKNQTLQNKSDIIKKIFNCFYKNKSISHKNQRYLSNNYKNNNTKKYNNNNNVISAYNLEKMNKLKGINSDNKKRHKRFLSEQINS